MHVEGIAISIFHKLGVPVNNIKQEIVLAIESFPNVTGVGAIEIYLSQYAKKVMEIAFIVDFKFIYVQKA